MNESSRFYSSLTRMIFLNAVIKPAWILGIDRQVQNEVGTAAYGGYFSLFNLTVVFSFLLDWGLSAFYNRQLAAREAHYEEKAGHFLLIKLCFALLYAATVPGVAALSGIRDKGILAGLVLVQIFSSLFLFFRGMVTARQWFGVDAWLSVLDKSLLILLCGSLLLFPSVFGSISIPRFVWLQVASTGLAVLAGWFILTRRGNRFRFSGFRFLTRQQLRAALPYALIVLLMSLHYRLDGFLLERIHPDGAQQAGIYAGAYRLLDAANMAGFLLASFLLPYIARQHSAGKDFGVMVLTVRHVLLLFSVGVACLGIFLGPWLQALLYRQEEPEAVAVLQWCLPALLGYSLVHIYGTVLTATGHIRAFCRVTLVAVLLNTSLNLWLLPVMGARGACIAALVSQLACGIMTMGLVKQRLQVTWDNRSLALYLFIAAVLGALFYFGKLWGISPWVLIPAGILLVPGFMVASGLLRRGALNGLPGKTHL